VAVLAALWDLCRRSAGLARSLGSLEQPRLDLPLVVNLRHQRRAVCRLVRSIGGSVEPRVPDPMDRHPRAARVAAGAAGRQDPPSAGPTPQAIDQR
jgi:hypothetical protein